MTVHVTTHILFIQQYIQKKAEGWGADLEVVAELRFNLDNTYKHHLRETVDIEVDFLRFVKKRGKLKSH